jgi:putative membrane protein
MGLKSMMWKAVLALAALGFCSFPMNAQTSSKENASTSAKASSSSGLAPTDRTFMKKAAAGGLAEVELGQLATQKASSPEVKQFGQRMVDDHSKANDQLKQIASQKGVALPDKLDAKDAATKARLEKLSGEEFDRAYMKDMVADHTKDVTEFRTEARNGRDPEVKNFASRTATTIEDHLKQAKSISAGSTHTHPASSGTH